MDSSNGVSLLAACARGARAWRVNVAVNWWGMAEHLALFVLFLAGLVYYGRTRGVRSRSFWIVGVLGAFVTSGLVASVL